MDKLKILQEKNALLINVYDAGPAVFDFSKTNEKGEHDSHVIRGEHRAIAEKLSNEFSNAGQKIQINIIFPTDKPFIPTEEEIQKPALFSSRIANSCETDIQQSQIVVANVSPWPKTLEGGKESVIADEGTVYELGYASGMSKQSQELIELAKTNHRLKAILPEILEEIGLPKVVVPYNASEHKLEERMETYYDNKIYQNGPLRFSEQDHTMLEEFGDKNNAMISNAARKQGIEPQVSFEDALRTGVEKYLELEKLRNRSSHSL